MSNGHARGKIVIDLVAEKTEPPKEEMKQNV